MSSTSGRAARRRRPTPCSASSSQEAGADGNVTVAEYEAAGGVIGALQHRANRLTEELGRRGGGESVLPTLTKFAAVEGDAEPTSAGSHARRSAQMNSK
jgi:hypothetical protein